MDLPHAGPSGRAARLDVREMEASDHRGLRRLAGDVFQVHGEALEDRPMTESSASTGEGEAGRGGIGGNGVYAVRRKWSFPKEFVP